MIMFTLLMGKHCNEDLFVICVTIRSMTAHSVETSTLLMMENLGFCSAPTGFVSGGIFITLHLLRHRFSDYLYLIYKITRFYRLLQRGRGHENLF